MTSSKHGAFCLKWGRKYMDAVGLAEWTLEIQFLQVSAIPEKLGACTSFVGYKQLNMQLRSEPEDYGADGSRESLKATIAHEVAHAFLDDHGAEIITELIDKKAASAYHVYQEEVCDALSKVLVETVK